MQILPIDFTNKLANKRKFSHLPTIAIVSAFIFISTIIGIATAILPWNMTLAFALVPMFFILAFTFPYYATILAIFLAFGAVPSIMLPQFSLAGGTVRASELFLLFVAFTTLSHALLTKGESFKNIKTPYTPPFIFLIALVLISSIIALGYFGNQKKYYLYELRVIFFWSIFPLILYSINSTSLTNKLLKSLLIMGALLSIGVVAQSITGQKILEASRVESLSTTGSTYSNITRSTAGGGIYFILFLINYSICAWAFKTQKSYISWPLIGLGGAAVLATFGRAVWFAESISVLILILLVPRAQKFKITSIGIASIGTLAVSLFVFAPDIGEATVDRLMSVGQEIDAGQSYRWRKEENMYAKKAILSNPLIGVALGGEYQPFRDRSMGLDHTRAIHSSYYYLALKFGILGLLLPIWFGFLSTKLALSIIKTNKSPTYTAIAASTAATLASCYVTSFTQPEWMHHTGVAFLSICFALLALIHRQSADTP